MRKKYHEVDFCLVGGGIAGLCAAVAAARSGAHVALMQDRPVLGGNASSEIRMGVGGAHGKYDREGGIVEELFLENYYRNNDLSYSIWDSVLYEKVKMEPNIVLLLNCTCQSAVMNGNKIQSVTGWQLTTETTHTVSARIFADCSGDSILAPLTGADFRIGREAREEFGESIAPEKSDKKTMGMSCLLQARETCYPQKFIPPKWAYNYPTDESLPDREHHMGTNYWWIELGGDRDSIHDTEELRDELLKIAFGVWDHVKNYGDHGAENWILDWVGFLPGKRESRRYLGEYILTQNDVEAEGRFEDIVAYGGWTMDDHFPEGFYYRGGHPTIYHPAPSPWGIPFRSLYSRNISNLMFAGRNISVTHSALSSSRVMATCGIIGQAVGTAAALAISSNVDIRGMCVEELQQKLMYDDCHIPFIKRNISYLTQCAQTNAPALKNGTDRAGESSYNGITCTQGEELYYRYDEFVEISEIRIIFDSDFERKYANMPSYYPMKQEKYKVPSTLVRSYRIVAETETGTQVLVEQKDNYQRMVKHKAAVRVKEIRLIPLETWGDEKFRIFSLDVK